MAPDKKKTAAKKQGKNNRAAADASDEAIIPRSERPVATPIEIDVHDESDSIKKKS